MSSFQIKNPLTVMDASKINSLVMNLISTAIPQDPAQNITLTHTPTITSGGTVGMQDCATVPDVLVPNIIVDPVTNVIMGVSSEITPATSSDAVVTSTMTPPVTISSRMTLAASNATVTTTMTIPVTMATPSGMALTTDMSISFSTMTSTMAFQAALTPITTAATNSTASSATTMPITTVETFSTMTMPSIVAVPAVPAVSTPIATNSAASSATTMPNTTVETFSTMTMPSTTAVPAASTPIATNSAASAMPVPTLTVNIDRPSITTVTTDAPMIATSNTLPPNGIEANTMITKKKLATKKCTMNSNTPKNLCAQDWVPAVGGTTEEFERHWDGLPEEEKQKYIKQSKQLKHAASSH